MNNKWRNALMFGLLDAGAFSLNEHTDNKRCAAPAFGLLKDASAFTRYLARVGQRGVAAFKNTLSTTAPGGIYGSAASLAAKGRKPGAPLFASLESAGSGLDDISGRIHRWLFSPNSHKVADTLATPLRERYKGVGLANAAAQAKNRTAGIRQIIRQILGPSQLDPAVRKMRPGVDIDALIRSKNQAIIDANEMLQRARLKLPKNTKLQKHITLPDGAAVRTAQVGKHNSVAGMSTSRSDWGPNTLFGADVSEMPNAFAGSALNAIYTAVGSRDGFRATMDRLGGKSTVSGVYSVLRPTTALRSTTGPDALALLKANPKYADKAREVERLLRNRQPVWVPDWEADRIQRGILNDNWASRIGAKGHEMLIPNLGQKDIARSYFQGGGGYGEITPELQRSLARQLERYKQTLFRNNKKLEGMHRQGYFDVDDYFANRILVPNPLQP